MLVIRNVASNTSALLMTILAPEVNDFIEARLSELNFTEPCVANLTQNNNDTQFLAAFSEFPQCFKPTTTALSFLKTT